MKALLDSSAWLAHLFGEAGGDEVHALLSDEDSEVFLSSLSLPEVFARIHSLGKSEDWPLVWQNYQPLFQDILPVDDLVAFKAIELRQACPERLPTIDSLVAATAYHHGLVLVHRDPHLASIPTSLLVSVILPEKNP